MDFRKLDEKIESYLEGMERDLAALVSYPSVEGSPTAENAPFGDAVRGALEETLRITEALGFSAHDMDGYCCYADAKGTEEEMVGVLGHLDVVPVTAKDWKFDPFTLTKEDGRLYGRGTMDDKGPMIAALYGMKALLDLGFSPKKTVRFIFGCNEETGMLCMKHYIENAPCPSSGFTPDAEWPLIVGEKGILHYQLESRWDGAAEGARLLSVCAGEAANVVPAEATACFVGLGEVPEGKGITVTREGERTLITATGAAAHASTPDEGENALSALLRYLAGLSFAPAGAKKFIDTMARLTQDDCYGESLGVASRDDLSRTTNAPTVCRLDETGGRVTLDMRFRLSDKSAHYLALLEKIAQENGLTFTPDKYQEPLYLGADNPLAKQLLGAYRDVTGDMTEPLVIGGGTYAKVMPGFLAFGPEPIGAPTRAHQANEYFTERELLTAAKIYARALYEIAK